MRLCLPNDVYNLEYDNLLIMLRFRSILYVVVVFACAAFAVLAAFEQWPTQRETQIT